MRAFRDLAIGHKLTLIIFLISAVVTLLGAALSFSYEIVRSRRLTVRDLAAQAELIGAKVGAPLAAGDARSAMAILQILETHREIVYACLYAADGRLFAEHFNRQSDDHLFAPPLLRQGIRYDYGDAFLFQPVRLGQKPVGTICLRSDLRAPRALLRVYGAIAAVVVLALLGLCLGLSARWQRIVSDPIRELTALTRRVSTTPDYSLRARKTSADEIGMLADGFNAMLALIQQRDQDLHASEQRFRQVTESIREVFWMTDVAKTQVLYISPAYEEIWGRTCASLYHSPQIWREAIHPEDRDRVWSVALCHQTPGHYDEEYRILRPDGSVRWIWDRAFPVRDETGAVIRLAGIAEDITERKRLEREVLGAIDCEQARIGLDLHDGLCQQLAGIAIAINLIHQDLVAQIPIEPARVHKIATVIDTAITQARGLARNLYPVKLEAVSLESALEELCRDTCVTLPIACEFIGHPTGAVWDVTTVTHLYRIAQEAVHNAVKHSHALQIRVELRGDETMVTLSITDNGVGISLPQSAGIGMGLRIMQYRARAIGATLAIHRGAVGGTIVSCSLARER